MLLIKPKLPACPGIFQDRAVSLSSSGARIIEGYFLEMMSRSWLEGTIFALSHLFPVAM
jgi:hypothetical protein